MASRTLASKCLPSTSRLPAPAPAARLFSTSFLAPAASTANRPKRDETEYGIPSGVPRHQWPVKDQVDTSKHPLWRFFHGTESLEIPDKRKDNSGRSWSAFELRRKNFEELHSLWYILLRERNVLLTQREEARRLRVDLSGFSHHPDKLRSVQKSMARVKQVLSERRHAALEAAEILRARGNEDAARQMEAEGNTLGHDFATS